MKNIKIKTKGMHCSSCEMLVKDSLEELDGVEKAEANFKSGIIGVNFDENKVTESNILKIIKSEGYKIK
ncbi:heavy-metal-associated domain-containing protein [Candidatus Woesearchaeota archaeon]|nr:heavy-metal-associated domain-containing protein [Candidatus Woesearchaeota archaeon]